MHVDPNTIDTTFTVMDMWEALEYIKFKDGVKSAALKEMRKDVDRASAGYGK